MLEKILNYLRKNGDYVSGQQISQGLNISRAGIWKHIVELRRMGYVIDASSGCGYRFVKSPDIISPLEVKFGLKTKSIGKNIIYFDSIPSTMDRAFELGLSGCDEGTVVCAETQTKGRGRLGRSWSSPKGKGLYFSFILRPDMSPSDASKLTLLTAVALCEAVRESTGIDAVIKWPNDIMVKDRKLAGILTEMNASIDMVKFVVVGIGMNINSAASQIPSEATSLKVEAGHKFTRAAIFRETLRYIDKWYDAAMTEGISLVLDRWRELSATLGKTVLIKEASGDCKGEAVDIDENGGLLIKRSDGFTVRKMSGDVQHIGAPAQ